MCGCGTIISPGNFHALYLIIHIESSVIYSNKVSEDYDDIVRRIFKFYKSLGLQVINEIAKYQGLDPMCMIELTDLLDEQHARQASGENPSVVSSISSSLLRVCSYPYMDSGYYTPTDKSDETVAFGTHTDTSFLTLGLVSSQPGLEVMDRHTKEWVCVEAGRSRSTVVILAGLQRSLLTYVIFSLLHICWTYFTNHSRC